MADNDRLPPKARAKIFALADQEETIQTAINANLRAINELGKAYDLSSDTKSQTELKAEVDRRQDVLAAQSDKHRALVDLNAKVRRYLELLSPDTELHDAKPIRLKPGKPHTEAVTDIRLDIFKMIGERSQVERAGPTDKEAKAMAARYVQSLAERGTPIMIIEHDKFKLQFGRGVIGEPISVRPDELLAWVDPTLLLARLVAQIDARTKPAKQMSATERKQRLDQIKSELFELERLEQAHIEAALDDGTTITLRPNTDIRALLGIVVSKSKAHAA